MTTDAQAERAAILRWLARYGDEINGIIARTPDGPFKTAMMGEFAATMAARRAIERGDHLALGQPPESA